MNVLFLALGGSRRHVIVAEAEHVLAAGGAATVLVGDPARWRNDPLPEDAEMVEWRRLVRGHRPAVMRLLVDRVPLFLMRVCLRGPVEGVGARMQSFHRRRVARPIHHRLLGFYQRDPVRVRERVAHRDLLVRRSIDLVVVGDAESAVTASELRDLVVGSGARLAYTAAHAGPVSTAAGAGTVVGRPER
ncbi:hypothetical protein BKA00_006278 [Actinomadura coerulea]|uniref:Uncharacterized protein n=1 Tax=Actinomadura coerulea TaxID=46159 RepID=A0A7X0L2K8_9ACTN|nr:hypothetical protein [Actinomadura coerulea]MBB6399364.1 hypothetical protein [Actinomadura coerulea]GGQ28406.1 hypothetical protein GCM10010187_51370 [Actinomadura coerulea]